MRLVDKKAFSGVEPILKNKRMDTWVTNLLDVPELIIERKCTGAIRKYLREQLTLGGWPGTVKIDPSLGITVFSIENHVAFDLQTGNMARAPYDLLKFQGLYASRRIDAAIFVLPTAKAAKIIGSNVANFERVVREMEFFNRAVSVPLLVLAFE